MEKILSHHVDLRHPLILTTAQKDVGQPAKIKEKCHEHDGIYGIISSQWELE